MGNASLKKRDASIELFRICIMLGICLLHVHTIIMHDFGSILTRSLMACVPAFAFLSGWFGIRFSLVKVVRLFVLAVFCSLVVTGWGQCFYGEWQGRGHFFFCSLQTVWHSWFLYAYFFLMIFAPLVNCAIEKDERILYPVLGLALGWSFLRTVFGKYIPDTEGLGSYSGLTLLGVYVFARLVRRHRLVDRLNKWWVTLVAVICCLVCGLGHGLQEYNSISCVLLAGAVFLLVKRVKVPACLERIILFVSPSMFAVYLLHVTKYGFRSMGALFKSLGMPAELSALVVAGVVFVVCVSVDVLRRVIFRVLLRFLNKGDRS